MSFPFIDTTGTRYSVHKLGKDSWSFGKWGEFLRGVNLQELSSFLELKGDLVDRNRRSVVYRVELGADKRIFYLKLHVDYFRQNLRTLYRKIPVLYTELTNIMHYGRAGIDTLEPVAWGYQASATGGVGFVLLDDLAGFCSLRDWLGTPRLGSELKDMAQSCAAMVVNMHAHGLAHIDLYSWHVFVKRATHGYDVIPLDLERTKVSGNWPWGRIIVWIKQLQDLAVLNITTPWPQVSDTVRLRFYLAWLDSQKMTFTQKLLARLIVRMSAHLCYKRKKFRAYGLAERFQQAGRIK